MPRVVVLGTGTGVGKTYVSRLLLRGLAAVEPNASVFGLKPIETGLSDAHVSDAELLAREARYVPQAPTRPLYGFAEPLAPYLAAKRAGAPALSLTRVVEWVRALEASASATPLASASATPLASKSVWSVIETAGGAWSPIAPQLTNVELWQALEPAVAVLVARDALGTLHDISATLMAMRAHGCQPQHLLLSAGCARDASTGTNAAVLEELGIATATLVPAGCTELTRFAGSLVSNANCRADVGSM